MTSPENYYQIPPNLPTNQKINSAPSSILDFKMTLLAQETVINELVDTKMTQNPIDYSPPATNPT